MGIRPGGGIGPGGRGHGLSIDTESRTLEDRCKQLHIHPNCTQELYGAHIMTGIFRMVSPEGYREHCP